MSAPGRRVSRVPPGPRAPARPVPLKCAPAPPLRPPRRASQRLRGPPAARKVGRKSAARRRRRPECEKRRQLARRRFSFREPVGSSSPGLPSALTRAPVSPPSAGPTAEQWAILRAPDAHGTAEDEGIRATPCLALPRGRACPRVGRDIWPCGRVWGSSALRPGACSLCLENRMEAATSHLPTSAAHVRVLKGAGFRTPK